MKKLMNLIVYALLACAGLEAISDDNDQIVVELETESRLMPLYLEPILDDQSGFSKEYIKQLNAVLDFDFNHNGATYTVKPGSPVTFKNFDDMGDPATWRSQHVYFLLKTRIKNKELSARLLAVLTTTGKNLEGMKLTGNLSQDRRTIHLFADTIHKTLFGFDGIASKKILYTLKTMGTAGGKDPVSLVWEADYDGANARQVSPSDAGYCVTPIYIPPKEGMSSGGFAYISYKTGQPKIYLASLKDGIGRRYSTLKGNQLMPSISRQRDKIAFISDVTGNPDLFIQGCDLETSQQDKPRQIYAAYRATQATPSFSPDGKRIAFVSNKDGSPRIYVMNIPEPGVSLKNIKAQVLSKFSKESSAPAWSPDGSKIAYCAMTNGARQIWVYDFDKNEERQLTLGRGHKENPSWAPNSLHIVYNTTDVDTNGELYMINLNQPGSTKISSGLGEKRFPSWEP